MAGTLDDAVGIPIADLAKVNGITKATLARYVDIPLVAVTDRNSGGLGINAGGTNEFGYAEMLIHLFSISTLSDTTPWGYLDKSGRAIAAASNGPNNRGVFAGCGNVDMCYITITSDSSSDDFGNLLFAMDGNSGCSNWTQGRAVFAGGGNYCSSINFINIGTLGNGYNFGSLVEYCNGMAGGCSNGTLNRGLFAGKNFPAGVTISKIQAININIASDAEYVGDLTVAKGYVAGLNNGSNNRGVFFGGRTYNPSTYHDDIEYVGISTAGSAQFFGNLMETGCWYSGCSNGTQNRGVIGGGFNDPTHLQYINIVSTGNAAQFGYYATGNSTCGGGATNN
jgi:hypothetical protein